MILLPNYRQINASRYDVEISQTLMPVLFPTFTVIFPIVVPDGTVVKILVAVDEITVAVTPLNFTVLFVVLKPDLVIVAEVPTGPLVGVKLVMDCE